jgi:hypothetical protein
MTFRSWISVNAVVTFVLALSSTSLCEGAAQFIPIAGASEGLRESNAEAISGDGKIVFGSGLKQFRESFAFRWSDANTNQPLEALPTASGFNVVPTATSDNGDVVVGGVSLIEDGFDVEAFRWTVVDGVFGLG